MSPVTLSTIIAAAGFGMSTLVSVLIVGVWGGKVTERLSSIDSRIARIEGAFTLVPTIIGAQHPQ